MKSKPKAKKKKKKNGNNKYENTGKIKKRQGKSTKNVFCEKISKIGKLLARLTSKKRTVHVITRNESWTLLPALQE